MSAPDPREDIILRLATDRRLAHQTLFAHRHPSATPAFHYELIDLWHGEHPKVVVMAFRGGAKSTLGEECLIVEACLRQFKNAIIIGESEIRAKERLAAIKYEFETNEYIESLFGDMRGPTWGETKIVLANGAAIQAYGRGQSLRGAKHRDARPDRVFVDDLEDEESVATPEARDKNMQYLVRVVLPAMNKKVGRIRINATPLDPDSVPMRLSASKDWIVKIYPVKYVGEDGEWLPTWPDHFPMEMIDRMEQEYASLGMIKDFMQEYMCRATDPAMQVFTADMFKIEPVVRSWQAVYAMYDPARTVKNTSAFTGKAVWSWVNNRLIVWDTDRKNWRPDETIADIFKTDEEYRPVEIGVEEDGLHEFVMQPIRQEQVRRGYAVPVRPMKAPKNKIDFIKGLQPFFKAGEVIFVKPMPELQAEFLSFPTGKIDAPNALAYALRMRPGMPIYENFSVQHIAEDIPIQSRLPVWLALNATAQCTTAVMLQYVNGGLHVLWDAVREGDPGAVLADLVATARLDAAGAVKCVAGAGHFDNHDTVGLRPAARKVPIELARGGAEFAGREEVRRLLRSVVRGMPALRVSTRARWTLNAFAGGYCQEITRHGVLGDFPKDGPHRTLMHGLETFAALVHSPALDEDAPITYAVTKDGRRYISALATTS